MLIAICCLRRGNFKGGGGGGGAIFLPSKIPVCGGDGDFDSGENGRMGLNADSGVVLKVEGNVDVAGVAAASAAAPKPKKNTWRGKKRSQRNWAHRTGPRPGKSEAINICGSRG